MREFTDGTLSVRAFDFEAWKQERNLLHVYDSDSDTVTLYLYRVGRPNERLATYTLDGERQCLIDVSDYMRVYPQDTFEVENEGGDSVRVNYRVVGLIRPQSVVIPECKIAIPTLVGFPSVMLQAINGVDTQFEMRGAPEGSGWESYGVSALFVDGANVMPNGVQGFQYGDSAGNYGSFIFRDLECGRRYASVRWVSYTGAVRVHTFEVQKCKSETAGAYELLTQDNSYSVVKGREDGMTLRLDGLTAYDVWYYSDVCHSSQVEVSLDGVEWQSVSVQTKGASIPDGTAGKMGVLEVEIKYKRYDAVGM